MLYKTAELELLALTPDELGTYTLLTYIITCILTRLESLLNKVAACPRINNLYSVYIYT